MTNLLTTTEVALRLGASADTIKLMCRDGRIPCLKVGGRYLIDATIVPTIKISPPGWKSGRKRKPSRNRRAKP